MQKTGISKIMIIAVAISVVALGYFVQDGRADIVGTDHDFSAQGWNGSGEICIVCHTPQNGDTSIDDAPLWNHEVTAANFTPYSSDTLDAAVGQPNGVSKLCLSCHDGTVAVDNFGGVTEGSVFLEAGDDGYVGNDLSNDHPISFAYDTALAAADGGLFDPSAQDSGLGSTIDDDMLFGGSLECASCHNAHGAGFPSFLRLSNAGSALCLTCHDK